MGLELPEDSFFGGELIVLVLEVNQVEPSTVAVEGFDRCDNSTPVTDRGEHADAWDGWFRQFDRHGRVPGGIALAM